MFSKDKNIIISQILNSYPMENKYNDRIRTYEEIKKAIPFKQINVGTIWY